MKRKIIWSPRGNVKYQPAQCKDLANQTGDRKNGWNLKNDEVDNRIDKVRKAEKFTNA